MSVRVINLCTQEEQIYTCSPREAVIAAYAQNLNDWNTWDYEERYGNFVEIGEKSFLCGNFAALKEG